MCMKIWAKYYAKYQKIVAKYLLSQGAVIETIMPGLVRAEEPNGVRLAKKNALPAPSAHMRPI